MIPRSIKLVIGLILVTVPAVAETGYMVVQVQDVQRRPVHGVEIGVEGKGGSRLSGDDGKAQLPLARSVVPGDWVSLQILHSPAGKDFVIISPWDYSVQVPSFDEKAENFIRVVVVGRGDRAALESGAVITALAAKINNARNSRTDNPQPHPPDKQQALAAVASQYGLRTLEVDTAIRAWGKKTSDSYEAGMAALYQDDYSGASEALTGALDQRQRRLQSDSGPTGTDQHNVADAALFLGITLFHQGKYAQAAAAFRISLSAKPADSIVEGNLAISLASTGDYPEAERIYRQLIQSERTVPGRDDLNFAEDLSQFGVLLRKSGNYAEAEELYREAIDILQKEGPRADHALANTLNDLGALFNFEAKYGDAEPILRRALAIDERIFGPDNSEMAEVLTNLGALDQYKGHDASAEAMYRHALAIDEKALGSNHPSVATDLNNIAQLVEKRGDRTVAESLLRRALSINEAALGPEHPEVATNLNNLAFLLNHKGNLDEAERLFRRALAIDEKALGPVSIDVARDLNNLGSLLQDQHKYAEAEAMYRRAIAIDEKALGPDHPITKGIRGNLSSLPEKPASPRQ
jgi:tetratricopeptide (TPR) repeat protein